MRLTLLLLPALLMLAACSAPSIPEGDTSSFPKTIKDQRKEDRGKIGGDEGGITLFGGGKKGSNGPTIGVSGFLWRATLDTLAFMPLNSADPFGGTILTDWYSPAETPGERFKINALILSQDLRADGVKIKLFKQLRDAKGNWKDAPATPAAERKLEDTILTRARELKVQSLDD